METFFIQTIINKTGKRVQVTYPGLDQSPNVCQLAENETLQVSNSLLPIPDQNSRTQLELSFSWLRDGSPFDLQKMAIDFLPISGDSIEITVHDLSLKKTYSFKAEGPEQQLHLQLTEGGGHIIVGTIDLGEEL